jgi:glucose 1-dehydrogenase
VPIPGPVTSATLFAQEGADIAIVYHIDKDGAQETARRIEAAGRRVCVIQGDGGNPESVSAIFVMRPARSGRWMSW